MDHAAKGAMPPYAEVGKAKAKAGTPGFFAGSCKMLTGSKLNLLLAVIPVAAYSEQITDNEAAIFLLSATAILPLAALLGDATEQVALHTNETIGGLLNATFGNATEMIISFFLLRAGHLHVVQLSLLGSILSNSLLVLGFACVSAGIVKRNVTFNSIESSANSTMLQVAVMGIVLPTLMSSVGQFEAHDAVELNMSRFISAIYLVLYCLYLVHTMTPDEPSKSDNGKMSDDKEEEEEEEVLFSLPSALFWLFVSTAILAFLSEVLSGAVEGAAEGMGLTKAFVGFVIIPIVGNAAEHSTAVIMAFRLKMDLALGVAQGSSTQIALFVIPAMVMLGWAIGQPLDLQFGVFETVITWLSTVIVASVINDGSTNWLEGAMLIASYIIISSAFFFYHDDAL